MSTNVLPIRALPPAGSHALATIPIVTSFREGEVSDDLLDALRAHQAFARTTMLLQRALDAARQRKRELGRELGRAVKRAWEDFGRHFAPEEWRPVDEAAAAARGGTATQEQLDLLVDWCEVTRQRFLGHDGAKLDKERALKAASGRIEDIEIALRRVILEQPGSQGQAQAQQDLPGFRAQGPAGASGVWDAKVRRVVVDVFAEEVRAERTKATQPEADPEVRAAAEAQAAADEALVAALRAMGVADDSMPDDLEDMEGDEDETAEEPEQAELPVDDIAAAEQHGALDGKPKARRERKTPTNRADGGGK